MPLTAATLRQFVRGVYVETGAWEGDGIAAALDAGFGFVHSVEVSPSLAEKVSARFTDRPVLVHLGDSGKILGDVLAGVTEPATIFLDAHSNFGGEGLGAYCPLLAELQHIANSGRKDHIILIDDLRLMGNEFPPSIGEIVSAVWRINPAYQLRRIEGFEPNDVLACTP